MKVLDGDHIAGLHKAAVKQPNSGADKNRYKVIKGKSPRDRQSQSTNTAIAPETAKKVKRAIAGVKGGKVVKGAKPVNAAYVRGLLDSVATNRSARGGNFDKESFEIAFDMIGGRVSENEKGINKEYLARAKQMLPFVSTLVKKSGMTARDFSSSFSGMPTDFNIKVLRRNLKDKYKSK